MKSMGTRLWEERKLAGYRQEELACKIGVLTMKLQRAEKDVSYLPFRAVYRMSECNLDVNHIVTGNKHPKIENSPFDTLDEEQLFECMRVLMSAYLYGRTVTDPAVAKDFGFSNTYVRYILNAYFKNDNVFSFLHRQSGMTQSQLAAKLMIDDKTFRKLEKGKAEPDCEMLEKLYEIYAITPAFVLKERNAMLRELSFCIEQLGDFGKRIVSYLLLVKSEEYCNEEETVMSL